MTETQRFIDADTPGWMTIDFLPGVTLLPLRKRFRFGR
jgi:hypothetical protein